MAEIIKNSTKVKAIVMTGYGINCDRETKEVLDYVGFKTDIVHINDLIAKTKKFSDYNLIVFAGGFSYGDDLGSGKAYAAMIKNHLWKELEEFKKNGGLAIGICNGFQIMTHLGLFSENLGEKNVSLLHNDSARYICKWAILDVNQNSNCIFTKGIKTLKVPIAHGEGKFYAEENTLNALEKNNQVVVTYIENPNGALRNIAGICDKSGKFFGLMPHPERAAFFHHLPNFHKLKEELRREGKEIPYEGDGIIIFRNAFEYLKNK